MIGIVIIILIVIGAIMFFNGWQNKWQTLHGTIFNVVIIGLLLFLFLSVLYVYKNKNAEVKDFKDAIDFGKIYLSWLSNTFGNVKGIVGYTVKQDWGGNSTGG